VGERVWIWNGQWRRPHGTAAEYIVLPSAQAVLLPEHIDYAEGACFGIPALTAPQAVRLAELSPASTAMIVGGAGSVAHYAIQQSTREDPKTSRGNFTTPAALFLFLLRNCKPIPRTVARLDSG